MPAKGQSYKKQKQAQNRASKRIGRKMTNDNAIGNNSTSRASKQKKKASSMLMNMVKKK